MTAYEVVIGDWANLGERVELVDPLTRYVELEQAALVVVHDLASLLSECQHVVVLLPVNTR